MKIMQLNVWQGRIFRPILNLIRQESPDILFTQEIFTYPGKVEQGSHWNFFRMFDEIAEAGTYAHTYFSPNNTFEVFGRQLSYGQGIFSKHSFTHSSTHYTGGPGPTHLTEPTAHSNNATRLFQHVVISPGNKRLNLINHHGHWVNQPQGDDISIERLQKIATYATDLEGPIILGGDLNLSPDSPAIRQLLAVTGLIDVTSSLSNTTLSAAHYVDMPVVCDYLLMSPGISLTQAKVSENLVSDHKALIVEADL